jgi:hypothetical protein
MENDEPKLPKKKINITAEMDLRKNLAPRNSL